MYDNIGEKIKWLAKIFCLIGIIGSIVSGFAIIVTDVDMIWIVGVLVAVGGSLVSWIGSFFIYGFGQLIENSDIIAKRERMRRETEPEERTNKERAAQNKPELRDADTQDEECYASHDVSIQEGEGYIDSFCPSCGEKLSFPKSSYAENEFLTCPYCNEPFDTARFK